VLRTIFISLLLLSLAAPSRAAADDRFDAGFAAGVLSAEYGVDAKDVRVDGTTVIVDAPRLKPFERRGAARALLRSPKISAVHFEGDGVYTRADAAPERSFEAFPRRLLFDPLIADPRWPAMSGSVVRHFRTDENLVFNGNVGSSLPLVGSDDWQFGLQATIFTQYDMKARHDDQMTDDFLVGLPYSWRSGRATWMARLYHISTHNGDEYLLHHPGFVRIKQSYEAVDLRSSYDLGGGWRVYGGPGYIYRRFPLEMKPWYAQSGAEYLHRDAWLRGLLRPVVALDTQWHQNYGGVNVSARAGFQIEHRSQAARRALLLLEYYRGRDVNAQFYVNRDESLGMGFYVFF
jgi:hypothetical protein